MPSSSDRIRSLIAEADRRLSVVEPGRHGSKVSQTLNVSGMEDAELGRNEQYAAMVRDVKRQGALARRNQLSDWAFAFYSSLANLLGAVKSAKRSRTLLADVGLVYSWYEATRGSEAQSLRIGGLGLGSASPTPGGGASGGRAARGVSINVGAAPPVSQSPALPTSGKSAATTPVAGFGNVVPSPLHETIVRGSSNWAEAPVATTLHGKAAGKLDGGDGGELVAPAEDGGGGIRGHALGAPSLAIDEPIVDAAMSHAALGDRRTAFGSSFAVQYESQAPASPSHPEPARIKPSPLVDATYVEYDRRLHDLIRATGGVSLGAATPRADAVLPASVAPSPSAGSTRAAAGEGRSSRPSVAALRLRARPWSASATAAAAATASGVASGSASARGSGEKAMAVVEEYAAAWEAPRHDSALELLKGYRQRNLMASYVQREAILHPKPPAAPRPKASMRDEPSLLPPAALMAAQRMGGLPRSAVAAPSPHLLVALEKEQQARSGAGQVPRLALGSVGRAGGAGAASERSVLGRKVFPMLPAVRRRPGTAPAQREAAAGSDAWLSRKLAEAEDGAYLEDLKRESGEAARARARAEEEAVRRIESATYASQTGGAHHELWYPADPSVLEHDMAPLKPRPVYMGSGGGESSMLSSGSGERERTVSFAGDGASGDDDDDGGERALLSVSSDTAGSEEEAAEAAAREAAKKVVVVRGLVDLASDDECESDAEGPGAEAWAAAEAAHAAGVADGTVARLVVAEGPVVVEDDGESADERRHRVLKAIRDNRVLLSTYEQGVGVAKKEADAVGVS